MFTLHRAKQWGYKGGGGDGKISNMEAYFTYLKDSMKQWFKQISNHLGQSVRAGGSRGISVSRALKNEFPVI